MNLLPYKRFEIQTRMTSVETVMALSPYVQTDRSIKGWLLSKEDFVGKLSLKGFVIQRKIGYTNAFLPVCRGKFVEYDEGTHVSITQRPTIGLFILFGIILWFFVPLSTISQKNLLHPSILLLSLYAGFWATFYFEAARVEKFLRQTLYP